MHYNILAGNGRKRKKKFITMKKKKDILGKWSRFNKRWKDKE